MSLEQFKTQILLLHSEQSTLDSLSTGFSDSYTVHCATSGSEALNTLGQTEIDVIVTAQDLPGMSGLDALREAKKRSPDTIGILLTGDDDQGVEALVGDQEVFQVIRGSVTPESLCAVIDNATRQSRLMALAESANDTTAAMDQPVSEHIVMETSENGSAIISDGTGRMPILHPEKVSPEANVGARAVDVLVLTKDEEFLTTVRESARGMHNVIYANTLAQADDAVRNHKIGVAVVDAAMVGGNVEKLTLHLRATAPRLVAIVAGRRDDGEMLMDLINRGKVYRFLLKPVSPGRARLAVEASVKHHLEAPDAAFKTLGSSAAPKAAPKAQEKAAPKAKAKPKSAKQAQAKIEQSQTVPTITVEPRPVPVDSSSLMNDALGSAFGSDDTSFTETMTGIVKSVGESISSVTSRKSSAATNEVQTESAGSGGSMFSNPKLLGVAAAAVVVILGLGWWMFGGSDGTVPTDEPLSGTPLITEADPVLEAPAPAEAAIGVSELVDEARLAAAAGQVFNPPGSNAIELYLAAAKAAPGDVVIAAELAAVVDQTIGMAETSLLDRRPEDVAAALQRVALADPANSRLPFLNAQLAQMQLRDYLDASRLAIREARYEDAAVALDGARALGMENAAEIEIVADELSNRLSDQRVDDVLVKANARLNEGRLTAPSNDNARYYYELALSNDPGNTVAQQGLTVVASKLVLQARTEIDAGRFDTADNLLADARRLDPTSNELAGSVTALAAARERVHQERLAEAQRITDQKAAEERAAAEKLAAEQLLADQAAAEKLAAEQLLADQVAAEQTAAEQLAIEQANIDLAVPDQAVEEQSTLMARPEPEQPVQAIDTTPVAISSLTRTKYVAPKYPRSAQRRGLTGWVDVAFTVDIDGSVQGVAVLNSDPGITFVNAAVSAVEDWEFEPVVENGIVVSKRAAVRMMFAME